MKREPSPSPSPSGPARDPERISHDGLDGGALGLRDATFVVFSSIVGVGIFLTPARIAAGGPTAAIILAMWAFGALLSWAGALANAELGGMFPRAGGDYVYLREGIHPSVGFAVGWLTFFAIYAGTIASLAAGFGDVVAVYLPLGGAGKLAIAILIVVLLTAVNALGARAGAWVNLAATGAKILAITALVLLGLLTPAGSFARLSGAVGTATGSFGWVAFAAAMPSILFSYSGWNASVYIASEIRDPERNLPRSLLLGLLAAGALYMAINVAYLRVLPVDAMAKSANVAGSVTAIALGDRFAWVISGLVLLSTFGTLNTNILVGPRIAYAMARDGVLRRSVGRVNPRTRAPDLALWVQAGAAIAILLLLRSFPRALDYTTFAILVATVLDVAVLYVLRVRQPLRARPFRAWGYPFVPALYGLANLAIAVAMVVRAPIEALAGLGVLASGGVVFLFLGGPGSTQAGDA